MIRYKSSRQMTIEEFRTPFKVKLDKSNRWIKLGEPSAKSQKSCQKRKYKMEQGMRNEVEGKFGQQQVKNIAFKI